MGDNQPTFASPGFVIIEVMRRGGPSSGFTLIELLVFVAIFGVVIVSFVTIFLSVLRVYSRQASSAEVDRQSQFLLQTLQNRIERSSLIELPTDLATNTLKLRTSNHATDPTYIYVQGGLAYIKETDNTTSTPESLTTSRVNINNLAFIKRNNAPGHDSVSLSFSMEYVTANPQMSFVQNLSTAIARVSAATFDSNLVASTSNTFGLGVGNANWKSINDTIYFNSTNVGIGLASPNSKLQVSGGDVYVDTINSGIILRSPNGTCYRVTVSNAGAFTSATTTCP